MGTDPNLCIFVLGMHRSGTSAMTRVLNLVGAELARHLIDATDDNASGHWEPERIVEANDQLLAALGSHWCDWRPLSLPEDADLEKFRSTVVTIFDDEFSKRNSIVVKDPRISRLVSAYRPIVNDLGYADRHVIMVRKPSDVGASLDARDGVFGPYASLLWLRYQLDAERATRGRPRVVVPFERLMADWRQEVQRILEDLHLTFAVSPSIEEAIGEFLDPEAVHHRSEAPAGTDQVSDWTGRAYDALLRLAKGADDSDAMAILDQVQSEIDAVPAWVGDVLAEHALGCLGHTDELTAANQKLGRELKASRARAKELRRKVEAMEASRSWRLTRPLRRKGPRTS